MTINNNKHAQKIIFILKTSSNENAWDIWENINSDNILLITAKNWHISFTDFLNNDLDMGQDNIDIIEIDDNLNNIYDLTINNGDKMKYDSFGVSLINKYDNRYHIYNSFVMITMSTYLRDRCFLLLRFTRLLWFDFL